jgi:hypothetical protein
MNAYIPGPLLWYSVANKVEAAGTTRAALRADLDRSFLGIRFRVVDEQDHLPAHMCFFVNGKQVGSLRHPRRAADRGAVGADGNGRCARRPVKSDLLRY